MKDPFAIGILLLLIVITISGCEWSKTPVLAIKNNTKNTIVGAALVNDSLTDAILYNDQMLVNIYDDPGESQDIGVKGFTFNNKNDSSKLYLYFFYKDTLMKYRGSKILKGILGKSLIKKQIIPLKTVTSFDTIFFK